MNTLASIVKSAAHQLMYVTEGTLQNMRPYGGIGVIAMRLAAYEALRYVACVCNTWVHVMTYIQGTAFQK